MRANLGILLCFSLGKLICQNPGYSDNFKAILEYEGCKILPDSVAKSWKPMENAGYYQSAFTKKTNSKTTISFPCMVGIKRKDAELLFGTPHRTDPDWAIYYTSKPFKSHLVNSLAIVDYNNSTLTGIKEISCPDMEKFVTKNFKYNARRHSYRSPLIPKQFAIDTIKKVECLKYLSKEAIIAIFGKPSYQTEKRILAADPMPQLTWDENGKKVYTWPKERRLYLLRYTADTVSPNKNSGFEMKLYPEPENSVMIVYGCNHTLDTIAKKWRYVSEKKIYECLFSKTEIELVSRCIFGTNLADIKKIFGEPNRQLDNELYYFLNVKSEDYIAPEHIMIKLNSSNQFELIKKVDPIPVLKAEQKK